MVAHRDGYLQEVSKQYPVTSTKATLFSVAFIFGLNTGKTA